MTLFAALFLVSMYMYHISMFTFRGVCGKFWPCPLLLLLKAVDTAAKILSVHSNIFWTGHHQVGQLDVPGSPPSAMPCFSCLPGGRETLEKVKDSIKETVKRRLSCISTCFPGDGPKSQTVDDTTQIPCDLHQSLLCAAQQAKSSKSGQHLPCRRQNGSLVLRLTEIARRARAQELKFASLGEGRQIGSLVKLCGLENEPKLNNSQGYIAGWDEKRLRFCVILEDGAAIALQDKNLKDPDQVSSPFEALDQFHKTCKLRAEEELKKLKMLKWHHVASQNSCE